MRFFTSLLLILILPGAADAGSIKLPRTGQVTCYDASGNAISCAGTGQDGEIQAGLAWPNPRFTDHGDGTVTDNLTALMWLKDANCIKSNYSGFDSDGYVTWQNALSFVTGVNNGTYANCGAGHTDWRLPNIVEQESLAHVSESNTALWLDSQGFANVEASEYWSGTTYTDDTTSAWSVGLRSGNVGITSKSVNIAVWPVRGGGSSGYSDTWRTGQATSYATGDDGALQQGVASPSPRFLDNGDGTVTDNLTGLIWLKDANCFSNRTWMDAQNMVTGFNANPIIYGCSEYTAPHADWRLPNHKEIFSLIDFSQLNPALPPTNPFIHPQGSFYWSGATYVDSTTSAWGVSLLSGSVGVVHKAYSFYVWPVRSGGSSGNSIIPTSTIPSIGVWGAMALAWLLLAAGLKVRRSQVFFRDRP